MESLPGFRDTETTKENHRRFVTRVAAGEVVWYLKSAKGCAYCDSNDAEDAAVLMFWSDEPYAKRVREVALQDCEVARMPLLDFLFRWLPGMADDRVLAGTNWTADLVGLEISPADLQSELFASMKPDVLALYRKKVAELKKQN